MRTEAIIVGVLLVTVIILSSYLVITDTPPTIEPKRTKIRCDMESDTDIHITTSGKITREVGVIVIHLNDKETFLIKGFKSCSLKVID